MLWDQIEGRRQEMANQVQSEWEKLGGEDNRYGFIRKEYLAGTSPQHSVGPQVVPPRHLDSWIAM